MKMWKRLVSAGLVAAMSGAMLAGCGNTAGNGDANNEIGRASCRERV